MVDMTGTRFCDSAGFSVLMTAHWWGLAEGAAAGFGDKDEHERQAASHRAAAAQQAERARSLLSAEQGNDACGRRYGPRVNWPVILAARRCRPTAGAVTSVSRGYLSGTSDGSRYGNQGSRQRLPAVINSQAVVVMRRTT
jgi:hypothetical protein